MYFRCFRSKKRTVLLCSAVKLINEVNNYKRTTHLFSLKFVYFSTASSIFAYQATRLDMQGNSFGSYPAPSFSARICWTWSKPIAVAGFLWIRKQKRYDLSNAYKDYSKRTSWFVYNSTRRAYLQVDVQVDCLRELTVFRYCWKCRTLFTSTFLNVIEYFTIGDRTGIHCATCRLLTVSSIVQNWS